MSRKLKYQIEVDTKTGEARVVGLGQKMADAGAKGRKGFENAGKGLDGLGKKLEDAGKKGRKGFENAGKGLDGLKKKLNKSISLAKKLGGRFTALAKKAGGLGAKVAGLGVAGAALAGALTLSAPITQFATFEKELTNVSTLVDTSTVDMEAFKTQILALPSALGSAAELTRGLYQTISAGVDPGKAMAFLEQSARAAKAGLTDTFTAVDAGSTIINAFGMGADQAGSIFDLMFTTVKEGKTTFSELAGSVGKISPIAAAAGVSVQEMHAAIATLTKGGFATSEASARLATALGAVVKPTAEAQEMAGALGLNFSASALAAQGLHGFLQDVATATGGDVEKMAQLFGGMESLSVMLALTGKQSEEFTRVLGSMEGAAGSTDAAFEKQATTLSSLWETFQNTVGKQAILIGEKLAPRLKDVIERTSEWMEANRELITEELGDWIEGVVEFVRNLKPALDSIIDKFSSWYKENKSLLQLEFVKYLKSASEAIGVIADNINLLMTPMRWTWTMLGKIRDLATSAVSAIKDLVQWMSKIPSKITTVFTGEGSTERHLGDKITEMQGRFGGFAEYVGSLEPKFKIDAKPATSALGGVAQIAAAESAARTAPETLAGGAYTSRAGSGGSARTAAMPVAVGAGIRTDTRFGDIHIHVPDSAAPQRPEDWRQITRDYIIPELRAVGYA